jgi:hypothetical protein
MVNRLGLIVVASGIGAGAQESTPAASAIPGYDTELLGLASSSAAPGQALQLIRITFAPGVETEPHARPGERINYVLEGTYAFHLVSGVVEARRAATGGAMGPAETLTPGDYTFTAGDAVFLHPDAVYSSRNPGPEHLVVLIAALSPAENLTTTYVPATPTP